MAYPTLKLNARSPYVPTLRDALATHGFHANYTVTDIELYDAGLYQTVIQYQRAMGLAVDGVVGTNTWAALMRPVGSGPVQPQPAQPDQDLVPVQAQTPGGGKSMLIALGAALLGFVAWRYSKKGSFGEGEEDDDDDDDEQPREPFYRTHTERAAIARGERGEESQRHALSPARIDQLRRVASRMASEIYPNAVEAQEMRRREVKKRMEHLRAQGVNINDPSVVISKGGIKGPPRNPTKRAEYIFARQALEAENLRTLISNEEFLGTAREEYLPMPVIGHRIRQTVPGTEAARAASYYAARPLPFDPRTGTPSAALAHDARIQELAKEMGLTPGEYMRRAGRGKGRDPSQYVTMKVSNPQAGRTIFSPPPSYTTHAKRGPEAEDVYATDEKGRSVLVPGFTRDLDMEEIERARPMRMQININWSNRTQRESLIQYAQEQAIRMGRDVWLFDPKARNKIRFRASANPTLKGFDRYGDVVTERMLKLPVNLANVGRCAEAVRELDKRSRMLRLTKPYERTLLRRVKFLVEKKCGRELVEAEYEAGVQRADIEETVMQERSRSAARLRSRPDPEGKKKRHVRDVEQMLERGKAQPHLIGAQTIEEMEKQAGFSPVRGTQRYLVRAGETRNRPLVLTPAGELRSVVTRSSGAKETKALTPSEAASLSPTAIIRSVRPLPGGMLQTAREAFPTTGQGHSRALVRGGKVLYVDKHGDIREVPIQERMKMGPKPKATGPEAEIQQRIAAQRRLLAKKR